MRRVNEKEFTQRVYEKIIEKDPSHRVNYVDVYWTVRSVLDCLGDIIENGDYLYLKGWFSFYAKLKKEKKVTNFGTPLVVPQHYVACFKPYKRLRDACDRFQRKGEPESCTEK